MKAKSKIMHLRLIIILFCLTNARCNNKEEKAFKTSYYKYDSTKFNQIRVSILKDTSYVENGRILTYTVDSMNEVIEKLKLCCRDTVRLFEILKYPIYVREINFLDKNKNFAYKEKISSSIKLIEWNLRDSLISSRMDSLLKCGEIYRCGTINAYYYHTYNNIIYFSMIYDYESHDEFKNILENVAEVYKIN